MRLRCVLAVAAAILAVAPCRAQDWAPPTQPPTAPADRGETRFEPALEQPEPPPVEPLEPARQGEDVKPAKKKTRSIAEDTVVRFRAGPWFTQLAGNVSSGPAFPGTISDIDLIDDLNLDPDQTVVLGGLGINFGKKMHLDVGYAGPFRFDGTSDPINISFEGFVFTGTVTSETDLDIYHVELAYDIVEAGPVTVALGFGVRVMDFSSVIEGIALDPGSGISTFHREEVDAVIPLPAPGLTVRWDLTRRLYLRGVIRGIYAGDYGNFFDAVGEVGLDFTRNIGIYGGYRWMHAEADVSDVAFNVDLDGFYAGVEVRF